MDGLFFVWWKVPPKRKSLANQSVIILLWLKSVWFPAFKHPGCCEHRLTDRSWEPPSKVSRHPALYYSFSLSPWPGCLCDAFLRGAVLVRNDNSEQTWAQSSCHPACDTVTAEAFISGPRLIPHSVASFADKQRLIEGCDEVHPTFRTWTLGFKINSSIQ